MFELDSPAELVGIISDSVAEESRLIARRLIAIAELLGHRVNDVYDEDPDPGYMLVTGFQRTSAEVAAAMNLAPAAAAVLVAQADALHERLPKLRALLSEGRIDWYTLQLVISRTEYVRDSVVADLDTELAERILNWQCWSRQRIINAVDSIVRTLDPDAIAERERAADRRRIRVKSMGDGNAKIDAIVSAEAGEAFDQRLEELAKSVCPQDPRTMDQRRDDALVALAEGDELPCKCGGADCPARAIAEQPRPSRIVINVIADWATVLGTGTAPAYLSGYGVIDADHVRELAERATLRLVDEPEVSRAEAMRYQPSAALERWIRCRDLTCRFPGCGRPAEICDVDHTVPFNHADPESGGLTVAWNLKCLCRQHHRVKTFVAGWHDRQLADGTVVWTSPAGRTYCTTPGGADLFPRLGQAACREPKPVYRNRSQSRSSRIERAHARNRRLRPVNEELRRVDRARRQEIERQRNRNRMRRTLQFFKGNQPSTSPFCAWINDPMEPEELPPDWRPPPAPPPGPDDPPF